MTWPTDELDLSAFDADSDFVSREQFYKLVRAVKEILAARGEARGVVGLNRNGRVSHREMGRGAPNGVASLGASAKIPGAEMGRGAPNGVASLDGNRQVPLAQLGNAPSPDASTTARAGVVRLATDAEAQAGREGSRALTPANLEAAVPDRLRCHVRVNVNGDTVAASGIGHASVTRISTGHFRVNFTRAFRDNVSYSAQVTPLKDVTLFRANIIVGYIQIQASSHIIVRFHSGANFNINPDYFNVTAHGRLA